MMSQTPAHQPDSRSDHDDNSGGPNLDRRKRPCLRVDVSIKRSMSFELKTDAQGRPLFQLKCKQDSSGKDEIISIKDVGEAGFRIQDFQLGSELGRGEGGGVRIALHRTTSQQYALKEINISDKGTRHQLGKELSNLKACKNHEYIVQLYDVCYHEGLVYEVLELMTWGSLEALIAAQWKNDEYEMNEDVLSIVLFSLLNALKFLHNDLDLVHADIKPSNCLLSRQGDVKLSDFGICRSSRSSDSGGSSFSGTMGYMSPERADGGEVSAAADMWSLGVVAVEYAAGRHPYAAGGGGGGGPIELIQRIVEDPAPAAELAGGLAPLVRACLHKHPARRPVVAAALAADPMARLAAAPAAQRRAAVASWLRPRPGPYAGLAPAPPSPPPPPPAAAAAAAAIAP